MQCVACGGAAISERPERTAQGYGGSAVATVASSSTNEPVGRESHSVSIRCHRARCVLAIALQTEPADLPEMFLLRGIEFTYEAVRDWEAKLTPLLIDNLRRRRGGGSRVRHSWYVDETYIKVSGRWCYLYRAIDRTGALVDVMLSETRDMAAAEKFFDLPKRSLGLVRPG